MASPSMTSPSNCTQTNMQGRTDVADDSTSGDSQDTRDLMRALHSQRHIYHVEGIFTKHFSMYYGPSVQAVEEVARSLEEIPEWDQCINGPADERSWGELIRRLGKSLALRLSEPESQSTPRSKLVTAGVPRIDKKTWRPDALVVDVPLGQGTKLRALGEIDLANIRAIIAQTWVITVLMPQLVLNFAKKVMDARPGCLFIYCLVLAHTDFYVMLIDRAGACLERCGKLTFENVDEGNKKFLTILAGLLLMSDEELGQSRVVKTTTPESAVVTLNGKAFTFNPQTPIRRPRGSLISRATAIYRATSDACVIKFSWPDILTQSDELSILKATRARMEALGRVRGTTRVPELLGSQVIGTVKSLRYDLNYTGFVRGSNNGEVLEPQYLDRQLVCLAVGPVGQSIKVVKNPRELVTTIRDIVLAIRDLFQVDIVHCDISVGNILLLRDPGTDDVGGFLVDFDHATDLRNPQRDKSFSGTVPFMSIGALVASSKGASHEQTYLDDLESLLYVFVTLLWEFYGERFESIPDTSTKVRVQYAVRNWRPENVGMFRKEFMTSYAVFKLVAFYDMLYESGPIKHGLSALGPNREVVFNTIIDAFRKVLFPSTRKTLEDRLPGCTDKADAERDHFAPVLHALDAVLSGGEIDCFNWKEQG